MLEHVLEEVLFDEALGKLGHNLTTEFQKHNLLLRGLCVLEVQQVLHLLNELELH